MNAGTVPHPSEFIVEEMIARGWTPEQLAFRMSDGTDRDYGVCRLSLDFYDVLGPDEPNMTLGQVTADRLGKAFGVSAAYFLALEEKWRASLPS